MNHFRRIITRFTALAAMVFVLGFAPAADAHLATFGSWDVTRDYLKELFPDASRFMVKRHEYSDAQVAKIEKELGFKLYPEDKTPTFYIAVDESSGKPRFLGVAIFVDPRLKPRMIGGAALRLEIGIAVDAKGAIKRIGVFDYRGNLALTRQAFLSQFIGDKLNSPFKVGEDVKAVKGEEAESQLVANAAREALFLMKISLGKKSR